MLHNDFCLLFICSVMSDSFPTSWIVAYQAPLSKRFPRQEYWSGLPFPSPGDIPGMGRQGMATHSSTLAWRIPRTDEPGRLQSLGSQRGGHD